MPPFQIMLSINLYLDLKHQAETLQALESSSEKQLNLKQSLHSKTSILDTFQFGLNLVYCMLARAHTLSNLQSLQWQIQYGAHHKTGSLSSLQKGSKSYTATLKWEDWSISGSFTARNSNKRIKRKTRNHLVLPSQHACGLSEGLVSEQEGSNLHGSVPEPPQLVLCCGKNLPCREISWCLFLIMLPDTNCVGDAYSLCINIPFTRASSGKKLKMYAPSHSLAFNFKSIVPVSSSWWKVVLSV